MPYPSRATVFHPRSILSLCDPRKPSRTTSTDLIASDDFPEPAEVDFSSPLWDSIETWRVERRKERKRSAKGRAQKAAHTHAHTGAGVAYVPFSSFSSTTHRGMECFGAQSGPGGRGEGQNVLLARARIETASRRPSRGSGLKCVSPQKVFAPLAAATIQRTLEPQQGQFPERGSEEKEEE